jgi:dipeptidyl aminopeptidase/acylaminoacyl peptidase
MSAPEASRIAGGAAPPRRRFGSLAAGLSLLGLITLMSSTQAAPLKVYGRLPRLENVALSPDGSRIALVKTEENTRVVAVVSLAEHAILSGVRAHEEKLRWIEWADDGHLMIVTSVTTVPRGFIGPIGEWFQMQVYDLKTGRLYQVPDADVFDRVDVVNVVAGRVMVRHVKDQTLLFMRGLQVTREVAPALIRVNLQTRECRVLRPGRVGNLGWVVDDAGEIAAEESYDNRDRRWTIWIHRPGGMQEVASGHEAIEFPRLLGWGPTADTLLLERLEDGDAVWRLLSLKDGSIGPPMEEKKTLTWPIEDPRTNRMIGGVHVGDSEEYVFFDPNVKRSWDTILELFHGERVRFESASADFHKMVVRVEGDRHGYRFELVDLDTRRASSLGEVYEGLSQPLEVRRITYTAADGLQIPAYVTLPRGKPPKMLPLIVLPHGGPAARDTADFHWWPQALADQGYAVLQPNYRGSDLGWSYISKGFGEWGRKMQTDLSDGVRYLVAQGIADPARVCIVGGSYGGYAALAGAALDPGIYRCAVSVAGLSDLKRMLRWLNDWQIRDDNRTQRYWDRFLGISGPNDPALEAISPIRHIDAITVPVLLIHGKDDTVVPYEQSQVMYDALKGARKDVQLVTLKHEDHWLSRGETRLQMLESSVAFLRAHNPPD